MTDLDYLRDVSLELARFEPKRTNFFRCPVCLRDLPVENLGINDIDAGISEEHIVPDSVGGKHTTFLCKRCNSFFGHKQTARLSEWLQYLKADTPFITDGKKQRGTKLHSGEIALNGRLELEETGAINFISDRKRSNKTSFDTFWESAQPRSISIEYRLPMLADKNMLEVGYLTAAYGLWFKHCGYSFVFQTSQAPIREQILNPHKNLIDWNFLVENHAPPHLTPRPCLMRFGSDCFPAALIYDQFVLLPSCEKLHPAPTAEHKISAKLLELGEGISARLQHLCFGPATLFCGSQRILAPDLSQVAATDLEEYQLPEW